MTDSEIIKALEQCNKDNGIKDCYECPNYEPLTQCKENLAELALDLINLQKTELDKYAQEQHNLMIEKDNLFDIVESQKAEIEKLVGNIDKLKAENERLQAEKEDLGERIVKEYQNGYQTAKAEAYKEFVERLKTNLNTDIRAYGNCTVHDMIGRIDNLLKEMVGEDNAV